MEMLLMILCMSIFGLAVTALAFGAATRPERQESQPQPQPEREPVFAVPPTRFFAQDLATPLETRPRVPIEALLLQIESHVRLEHAAAESFLESPTSVLLHSKTASPFLN
jgi:hypothetical protein